MNENRPASALAESPRRILIANARNAAILRASRDVLVTALATRRREAAIKRIELLARSAQPTPTLRQLSARWRQHVGPLLAAVDVLAVLAAWLAAGAPLGVVSFAVSAAVVLLIGNRIDLYRSRLELSALDDLPANLLVCCLAATTAAGLAALVPKQPLSGMTYLAFGALCVAFVTVGRTVAYAAVRKLRRIRHIAHPVIIVGAGHVACRLAQVMLDHPEYGLRPAGFVEADECVQTSPVPTLPLLGDLAALPDVVRNFDVHDIVFAFGAHPDAQLVRVVRAYIKLDLQVFVVPRYFEAFGADRRARVELLWGVPLLRLRRWPLRPAQMKIKRAVDIAVAGLGLILAAPLIGACALAIRVGGGRQIIFRQTRIGRDGRMFTLLKFCSMRPEGDEGERRWSIDGDERITRVGRFLRRTSLDELLQLVNILRGDMSLVGPRPERPFFVQGFAARLRRYPDRHRVASGLTGLAQVNGLRGDTSITDRVVFDNYYIEHWSLWGDTKIMLRTLVAMMRLTPTVPSQSATPETDAARRSDKRR